ncbi:MAG: orotate phosphoribosyltransferase [Alphaproteobacteria bacterium]|nr:orotate phosphoribosyltransferase [Alphaproteobacteria bacterium]
MDNTAILKEFEAAEAILKGHFILSSGLHSDTYLQCARVMMDANRGERLCKALAAKIRDSDIGSIDICVAPAMGGVVVGYELARQLGVEGIFCERQNGTFTIRRGFSFPQGARVLMVEDVVTTGKSSLEAMECVRECGGVVVGEASLVNRSDRHNPLPVPLISLLELEVQTYFTDSLPAHLQAIDPEKPGSRWIKS